VNGHRLNVPLLNALRDPATVLDLDAVGWNDLLLSARRHALLARLAMAFEERGLLQRLPGKVLEQFADARAAAASNQTIMGFEANRVLRALRGLDVPVVLLKGGAYLMAGLSASRGRLSADLDILVPRARLAEVEQAFLDHGWETAITESYDQHYYRAWSHQIPPLRHRDRSTELDVHHTIAPPTGRATPDARALLQDARPIGNGRMSVLAPEDMVLHSAVHLFNEQMTMGLRDLLDLHELLGEFGRDKDFWPRLLARARLHGMERPLYYCLRYVALFYRTPVPAEIERAAGTFAPGWIVRTAMDWLVPTVILPDAPHRGRTGAALARWLIFVRSHWLRMPHGMLARHLIVKALRRHAKRPNRTAPAA